MIAFNNFNLLASFPRKLLRLFRQGITTKQRISAPFWMYARVSLPEIPKAKRSEVSTTNSPKIGNSVQGVTASPWLAVTSAEAAAVRFEKSTAAQSRRSLELIPRSPRAFLHRRDRKARSQRRCAAGRSRGYPAGQSCPRVWSHERR